jgi:hypothetical protein
MDALNRVVAIPAWAYDFCWYYFAIAVIVAVYAIWAVVQLISIPAIVKRFFPTTALILGTALSGLVMVVLAMMQFWICRGALAPKAAPAKEAFATACKTGADCTAVAGTPQGPTCTCGGRGFCGGCVMQNNMEPSVLTGMEGFAPGAYGRF